MPILLSHFLQRKNYVQVRVCCHLLIIPMPTVISSFLFTIYCHMFSQKRRAWQGSNLQSSDSQSDAFPLRHRPFLCHIRFSLSLFFFERQDRLPISASIIGRFISSRIHPFPSEHGSKDAQSLFSTIMFTQMGTSGNLPFCFLLI